MTCVPFPLLQDNDKRMFYLFLPDIILVGLVQQHDVVATVLRHFCREMLKF